MQQNSIKSIIYAFNRELFRYRCSEIDTSCRVVIGKIDVAPEAAGHGGAVLKSVRCIDSDTVAQIESAQGLTVACPAASLHSNFSAQEHRQ
jgi:hypothetical protein